MYLPAATALRKIVWYSSHARDISYRPSILHVYTLVGNVLMGYRVPTRYTAYDKSRLKTSITEYETI